MPTYRVSRTATVYQWKDVEVPHPTDEDTIIDISRTQPWHDGTVLDSSVTEVKEVSDGRYPLKELHT
jgi:hypothetical protein